MGGTHVAAQRLADASPYETVVWSLAFVLGLPLITPVLLAGIVRAWLRPFVVRHVNRGLEWVLLSQKHQHSVLTVLFAWSCETVSVPFYAIFLSSLIWVRSPLRSDSLRQSLRCTAITILSWNSRWATHSWAGGSFS